MKCFLFTENVAEHNTEINLNQLDSHLKLLEKQKVITRRFGEKIRGLLIYSNPLSDIDMQQLVQVIKYPVIEKLISRINKENNRRFLVWVGIMRERFCIHFRRYTAALLTFRSFVGISSERTVAKFMVEPEYFRFLLSDSLHPNSRSLDALQKIVRDRLEFETLAGKILINLRSREISLDWILEKIIEAQDRSSTKV